MENPGMLSEGGPLPGGLCETRTPRYIKEALLKKLIIMLVLIALGVLVARAISGRENY